MVERLRLLAGKGGKQEAEGRAGWKVWVVNSPNNGCSRHLSLLCLLSNVPPPAPVQAIVSKNGSTVDPAVLQSGQ